MLCLERSLLKNTDKLSKMGIVQLGINYKNELPGLDFKLRIKISKFFAGIFKGLFSKLQFERL